jgi:hypothetical protein
MRETIKAIKELKDWFDGKKTNIGAIILFIAVMPHLDSYVYKNII